MSLTSGVKLHIHLLNVVVRFIVFLTSATLIFRCMDISKCFREFIGIRDNESRLYFQEGYLCRHGQKLDQTNLLNLALKNPYMIGLTALFKR